VSTRWPPHWRLKEGEQRRSGTASFGECGTLEVAQDVPFCHLATLKFISNLT
jgi:hypothetical protein